MIRYTLTADQIQARLDELALNYTDSTLSKITVTELCRLVDGLIPNLKSKRKGQILSELLALLAETRERLRTQAKTDPTPIDKVIEGQKELELDFKNPTPEAAKRLYQRLRVVAIDSKNLDDMRGNTNDLVMSHVTSEIKRYSQANQVVRKTEISKCLRKAIESESPKYKQDLEVTVEYFIRSYTHCLQATGKELIKKDAVRVSELNRTKNERVIDGDKLLEFARKALTDLDNWENVSIALIMATGRRMAEIHGARTVFKKVDKHTLNFYGQIKTKGRGDIGAYDIPCLLPADMILNGRAYLELCERVYQSEDEEVITTTDLVNKKCSMQLSRAVANHFKTDEAKEIYGNIERYYDFRAVYANICYQIAQKKNPHINENSYLADILGHGLADNVKNDKNAANYIKFAVKYTQ